jgi:hypothetical protein
MGALSAPGKERGELQATPVPGYRPSKSTADAPPQVQESSRSGVGSGLSTTRRFGDCALDHIFQQGIYVPAVTCLLLTVALFPNRHPDCITAAQRGARPLLAIPKSLAQTAKEPPKQPQNELPTRSGPQAMASQLRRTARNFTRPSNELTPASPIQLGKLHRHPSGALNQPRPKWEDPPRQPDMPSISSLGQNAKTPPSKAPPTEFPPPSCHHPATSTAPRIDACPTECHHQRPARPHPPDRNPARAGPPS